MGYRSKRKFIWLVWAALFLTVIGLSAETQIAERLEAAQRAERAQDYAAASREYEEILKVQPNLPLIRQSLAITYHLQNRFPEAIAEFQRALRLDATLWGTYLFLGMDYYKTNQFALAIPAARKEYLAECQNDGARSPILVGHHIRRLEPVRRRRP